MLDFFFRALRSGPSATKSRSPRRTQLFCERLEDRDVPSAPPGGEIPPPNPVTELVVTTVQDVVDPNDDNVTFSLREAILRVAPATAGTYKITFAQNIRGQTITLDPDKRALLVSADNGVTGIRVSIDGSAMNMTVQRDKTATEKKHTLFRNSVGTALTLTNLNLREGSSTDGGAVSSFGNLTVQNCDFRKNEAAMKGGAIFFDGGTLAVINSEFTFNYAELGGAVSIGASAGFVSMTDTTVQLNKASAQGGGIYIEGATGQFPTTVVLSHVTVELNEAQTYGGGICVVNNGAGADLTLAANTRIEKNQARNPDPELATLGGGIYFGRGTLRATGVTIGSNSAASGTGMYRVMGTTLVGTPTYEGDDTEVIGS